MTTCHTCHGHVTPQHSSEMSDHMAPHMEADINKFDMAGHDERPRSPTGIKNNSRGRTRRTRSFSANIPHGLAHDTDDLSCARQTLPLPAKRGRRGPVTKNRCIYPKGIYPSLSKYRDRTSVSPAHTTVPINISFPTAPPNEEPKVAVAAQPTWPGHFGHYRQNNSFCPPNFYRPPPLAGTGPPKQMLNVYPFPRHDLPQSQERRKKSGAQILKCVALMTFRVIWLTCPLALSTAAIYLVWSPIVAAAAEQGDTTFQSPILDNVQEINIGSIKISVNNDVIRLAKPITNTETRKKIHQLDAFGELQLEQESIQELTSLEHIIDRYRENNFVKIGPEQYMINYGLRNIAECHAHILQRSERDLHLPSTTFELQAVYKQMDLDKLAHPRRMFVSNEVAIKDGTTRMFSCDTIAKQDSFLTAHLRVVDAAENCLLDYWPEAIPGETRVESKREFPTPFTCLELGRRHKSPWLFVPSQKQTIGSGSWAKSLRNITENSKVLLPHELPLSNGTNLQALCQRSPNDIKCKPYTSHCRYMHGFKPGIPRKHSKLLGAQLAGGPNCFCELPDTLVLNKRSSKDIGCHPYILNWIGNSDRTVGKRDLFVASLIELDEGLFRAEKANFLDNVQWQNKTYVQKHCQTFYLTPDIPTEMERTNQFMGHCVAITHSYKAPGNEKAWLHELLSNMRDNRLQKPSLDEIAYLYEHSKISQDQASLLMSYHPGYHNRTKRFSALVKLTARIIKLNNVISSVGSRAAILVQRGGKIIAKVPGFKNVGQRAARGGKAIGSGVKKVGKVLTALAAPTLIAGVAYDLLKPEFSDVQPNGDWTTAPYGDSSDGIVNLPELVDYDDNIDEEDDWDYITEDQQGWEVPASKQLQLSERVHLRTSGQISHRQSINNILTEVMRNILVFDSTQLIFDEILSFDKVLDNNKNFTKQLQDDGYILGENALISNHRFGALISSELEVEISRLSGDTLYVLLPRPSKRRNDLYYEVKVPSEYYAIKESRDFHSTSNCIKGLILNSVLDTSGCDKDYKFRPQIGSVSLNEFVLVTVRGSLKILAFDCLNKEQRFLEVLGVVNFLIHPPNCKLFLDGILVQLDKNVRPKSADLKDIYLLTNDPIKNVESLSDFEQEAMIISHNVLFLILTLGTVSVLYTLHRRPRSEASGQGKKYRSFFKSLPQEEKNKLELSPIPDFNIPITDTTCGTMDEEESILMMIKEAPSNKNAIRSDLAVGSNK